MADEIAQVVDLEYKGIYYLLKGTKAMIATMVNGIKALSEWNHKKWLEKPGSCSWQKIQEASEGMAPIMEFPKEMFEQTIDITGDPDIKGSGKISPFEYYCQKNGLRYCIMPDLNPYDDYIPVAVLAQDFGIHDEQIKSYMRKRVENEEACDKDYDEKIKEAEERLEEAKTPEEKEEIEKEIEALKQGKAENSDLLKESKQKMERSNVLDFAEYLKQGAGSRFEEDPSRVMAQAETCGVVKEFMAKDCMYPIRDEGLLPESREIYYSQKTGDDTLLTVKRSFEVDENGMVYSIYEASDPESGKVSSPVSDRGCNMEAWAKKLPQLLKEAGMYQDQPMAVTRSEDNYKDYVLGLDLNFSEAREGEKDISKEAQIVIDSAKDDTAKREAYAKSFYSTLTVPSTSIMPNENQILSLELDDGLVEGVSLVGMNSDSAKISIRSDENYTFTDGKGRERTLTGDEIIKAIEGKGKGRSEVRGTAKSAVSR